MPDNKKSPLKFPPVKVIGQKQLDHALSVVKLLPIDEKKPWIVKFTQTPDTRTEAQRRLYFKWVEEFAKHVGYCEKELHEHYKSTFVFDTLKNREETDEVKNPIYRLYRELVALYEKSMKDEASRIAAIIKEMISTNSLLVDEMTELLRKVERDASISGAVLESPDYRGLALGERGR